jgi:hypothetical protein
VSAGGWVKREHDRRMSDVNLLAPMLNRRARDVAALVQVVNAHILLRTPLPNVLAYAAARRDAW